MSASEAVHPPSRTARLAVALGWVAAAAAVVGVLGIHVGLLSPFVGFRLFGAGAVLGGLLTLVLAAIALVATRGARDPAGRRRAWRALALGAGLVAVVGIGAAPGIGLPAINDITTDLEEPPRFVHAPGLPGNEGGDMSYPPAFVEVVREAYPDLEPLRVDLPREEAFRRAVRTAEELGWDVTYTDPASGRIEARDVSLVFRFVDDVAIRVRSADGGSRIDLRSRSRVGRGDVGANAARIRAFAQRFGA